MIWGSTYLGIELTGETIPPLFAVGVALPCRGAAHVRLHRLAARAGAFCASTRASSARAILVGALLPGANAILFVAEQHVADRPLGADHRLRAALDRRRCARSRGDRPPRAALAGVVVGFGGLVAARAAERRRAALVAAYRRRLGGHVGAGSFLSGRLPLPRDSFAATSYEMLAGGLILLPIGLATTHPHFSQFSGRSIFGFFYLVTFGSVVGYTAYVWLLDNAPLGTRRDICVCEPRRRDRPRCDRPARVT